MLALVGCGSDSGSSGTKMVAIDPDDQARFDRERQPAELIRVLGLKPGMVVADIGAGTGLLTVHLARAVSPGGVVVATDIDAAVLDYLRVRMTAAGYEHIVERRLVKPTDPGLEPARYDAILLAQVDHYLEDRVAWLRNVRAALVPGGKLAIANRMHHRAASLAAAEAAGLRRVTESTDIPGQYVAVFDVPAPVAAPPTRGVP